MRLSLCVIILSSLVLLPLAHAHDLDAPVGSTSDAFVEPGSSSPLDLGHAIVDGEANYRASILAAHVLISSVVGPDDAGSKYVVSERQRDAVAVVLQEHNFFERLAQLYASAFSPETLSAVAAWYEHPQIARFWRFQSAAASGIVGMVMGIDVELPESIMSADEADAGPASREDIAQLVAFWFQDLDARMKTDALIAAIQEQTTAGDIAAILIMSQSPAAAQVREMQASPKLGAFDHKEQENPRLRNDLTNAVLRTN